MEKIVDITEYYDKKIKAIDGVESKFWVEIDNSKYLFKFCYDKKFDLLAINEVFVSYLCKKLDISCVDAKFAICKTKNAPLYGCLVKSFLENDKQINESLFSLARRNKYEPSSKFSTSPKYFEGIIKQLKSDNVKIEPNFINNLKKIAFIDYLTCQMDRHAHNLEAIIEKKEDGSKYIKLAPMFDNGRCLAYNNYFYYRDLDDLELEDNQLFVMNSSFTGSNNIYGIVLEILYNKEIADLYQKVKQIDFSDLIKQFEIDSGVKIQPQIKNVIYYSILNKLDSIDKIISQNVDFSSIAEKQKESAFFERKEYITMHDMEKIDYYINYLEDKAKNNGKPKFDLYHYIKQNDEYTKKLEEWRTCKSDYKPTFEDYQLLGRCCFGAKLKSYQERIRDERAKRFEQLNEFDNKYNVPDFNELDFIQSKKDLIKQHLDKKELKSKYDEIVKKYEDYKNKRIGWLKYGDDFCEMPRDIKSSIKSYDEDVLKYYILNYELNNEFVSEKYELWIKKVGLEDYAKNMRTQFNKSSNRKNFTTQNNIEFDKDM